MCLSFFILWLSFLSNIRSSSWELGVLRSIGLNTTQITLIYVYEAVSLMIAYVILGTMIGLVTAYMIIIQFNLFMMMPLTLDFPYSLYIPIVASAFIVAVLGSYLPMRQYIKAPVADVLRSH